MKSLSGQYNFTGASLHPIKNPQLSSFIAATSRRPSRERARL